MTFVVDWDFKESLAILSLYIGYFLTVASCERSFSKVILLKNYLLSHLSAIVSQSFRSRNIINIQLAKYYMYDFDECFPSSQLGEPGKKFWLEVIHLWRPHGGGRGVRLRWTHVDGGPVLCGRPHRKLILESTGVILSSHHAKKLASFFTKISSLDRKIVEIFLRYKLVI